MTTTTKNTKVKIDARTQDASHVETEISKIGIGGFAVASGLIGLWAVACMVSGLVQSGGPLSFVKSWFGAVIG